MTEVLGRYRERIVAELASACRSQSLSAVNAWGSDLSERLFAFSSRGKLIRGSFVAAAAEAFGVHPGRSEYTVAAAMELIQSFLLIHDDIMDQDPIRRGQPAVYEQYRRIGQERSYRDVPRFGESMGICAGDVAMLLAFQALSTIDVDAELRSRISGLVAREIADVGLAQMGDVAHGHASEAATEAQIVSVYRYKTGRYTFSLPLTLGALLAEAPAGSIERLGEWGELQGVVFQIRDDQLGLFGESQTTGKPTGSDVSANKQTLHRLVLLERIGNTEWADVAQLFGKQELTREELERVRAALLATGTVAELDTRVSRMRDEARALIVDLPGLTAEGRIVLEAIDAYNADRVV